MIVSAWEPHRFLPPPPDLRKQVGRGYFYLTALSRHYSSEKASEGNRE